MSLHADVNIADGSLLPLNQGAKLVADVLGACVRMLQLYDSVLRVPEFVTGSSSWLPLYCIWRAWMMATPAGEAQVGTQVPRRCFFIFLFFYFLFFYFYF